MRRFAFICVLCVIVAASISRARAAETVVETIAEIAIEAEESIDESQARALIQSKVGQPYDSLIIQEDLKRLSTIARRAEARRQDTPAGVKLIFMIRANPTIQSISVVGNTKFTDEKILNTLPVKVGDALAVDAVQRIRDKLLKDYRSAGHMGARINVESIESAEGVVSLQIRIDEGERLKIKEIKIEGADQLSERRIKWRMQNKGSWLFFDNYYDEAMFEEDLQDVRRLYLSYGYFDADVRAGEFIQNSEKKEITPVILITEGARYTLSGVEARGATLFGRSELEAPFQNLLGAPFDAQKLSEAADQVRALYTNEGFLLAQIQESYDRNREQAQVNVILNINEGGRVRVGDVIIEREGNNVDDEELGFFGRFYSQVAPPVKDEAIQREVQLQPGEVYRKNLEQETVQRLERMGIFDQVRAYSEPTSDESVRDLIIEVDEGVTGNLIFGAGFGDATGAFVFGSYTERNLFGEARDLRANVLLGTKVVSGAIGYYDRYWQDDASLAVDLFKSDYARRGYRESEAGLTAEVGQPFGEDRRIYYRGRVGYVWLDEEDDLDENLRDYAVATARVRVVEDTTDSNVWPTEGQIRSAAVEAGYAGGPLVKLSGRFAAYQLLRDDLVYALNVQAGLIPFDAEKVGIGERFFMGGTEDVRGFAFRGAGPMDSKETDVAIGGSTKLLVQNELRFTLLDNLGISQRKTPLRGLVFGDIGMLGRGPLELDSPRASVGAGLRADLQHVNVGIDFAAPVLKESDDRTQWFHFKISSQF